MPSEKSPLTQLVDIRRDELPQALLMFAYFFLVITTFAILKPLKAGLFFEFYDKTGFSLLGWRMTPAQAELLAKVLNMVVAFVAATVFSFLSRSLRRQQLTYVFSAFIIACCFLFTLVIESPSGPTVWSFYFFGDLYSTVMVATFFAFLNDSFAPEKAKRLYGLIGLGGVSGGAFGATLLAARIQELSLVEWLWVCLVVGVVIVFTAGAAGRLFARTPLPQTPEDEAETSQKDNPVTAGAKLVLRSRYLLSIVAIVGLYEMVSTTMDFQFKSAMSHFLDGPEIGVQFANVAAISNWVSLFVQLFLTSFVMTRFGVGRALLVLPATALLGSVGFLITPLLATGTALYISDNGFNNSINQSAKEVLYTPTGRKEKYQAKAFIYMFVIRFSKALGVGINLAITMIFTGFESVRWLSLISAMILVAWIRIVHFAGREFDRRASEHPSL